MNKKLTILAIVAMVAALALVVFSAHPAFADKPGGNREALNDALTLGAYLHLERQGTYSEIDNTWEYVIGSLSTGLNVQGISATGLLAAYERTGDTDYLNGAMLAGDTLVERYDAAQEDRGILSRH